MKRENNPMNLECFVEDLFLGGQWSIILGYRRLSVKSLLVYWQRRFLSFISWSSNPFNSPFLWVSDDTSLTCGTSMWSLINYSTVDDECSRGHVLESSVNPILLPQITSLRAVVIGFVIKIQSIIEKKLQKNRE